jgi:hypothetical protein
MADKYVYHIQTAGEIEAEPFERKAEGPDDPVFKALFQKIAARIRYSNPRLVRIWEKESVPKGRVGGEGI